MTFKEVEKILKRDGWYLESIRGSHCKYKHPTKVGTVIVPNHKGDIPNYLLLSVKRRVLLCYQFILLVFTKKKRAVIQ